MIEETSQADDLCFHGRASCPVCSTLVAFHAESTIERDGPLVRRDWPTSVDSYCAKCDATIVFKIVRTNAGNGRPEDLAVMAMAPNQQ